MKRVVAIILAVLLMIPTGITAMAAGGTITSVNLPVSQTDFYTSAAIESPVFYSSLECVVNNKTVTVDGFAWECSNYAYDTAGTYVFYAVAPSGYTFDCAVPTITVNMKSGSPDNSISYYYSSDYQGQKVSLKAYPEDDTRTVYYDRTGFNEIRTGKSFSSALCLVAGIKYDKTMTEATVSDMSMSGGTATLIYGGSYGTNYIGTSNIHISGGTVSEGVYAGGVNGLFEGTTNIFLSGSPSIRHLVCGGNYDPEARIDKFGDVVGGITSEYEGTVNVYIAEDFEGDIMHIDFADADEVNLYISSGAKFDFTRYQINRPSINVYIDDIKYDVVTQIDYAGPDFVIGELGTSEADVIDEDITVYIADSKILLSDITWESADFSSDVEGVYTFTPVLPGNYYLPENIEIPEINVLVAKAGSAKINSVSYLNQTVIPDGIALSELDMPDTVTAEFTLNGNTYNYDISATFASQDYSSVAGTYNFALSVDSVFDAGALPALQVTVSEEANVNKSGDVYEVISTGVRFSGEKRKNYKITDTAGIYTYYDNVDVVNAVYAKGGGVKIAVNSDVVYVENKIDLNGASGAVTLDIPAALVTRVRYDSEIAGNVYINGVQMSQHTDIEATVDTSKPYIYANGVPSIVAYGEDGGTYLYRSNDMSLMYDGDITGCYVFGGGASGTTVNTTNIAFMSGYLYAILGAGAGNVNDSTLVLDGGSAERIYGGGLANSVTLHTTVILENGQVRDYLVVGGSTNSVMGDSAKTYADDEYTNELHMYGGSYTYLYLGSRATVYGNVKMVQHGGVVALLYSSGSGTVNGNVDITAYDGIWERQYTSKNITGKSRLKLFKGILHTEYDLLPYIVGDNLNITYHQNAGEFEYIEYTNNREGVISTADDAGKLVIRFLETRYPGEIKFKQRNFNSTADCIYITFPNGTNMLMDTGRAGSAPAVIATLKELGVEKLDYIFLTHQHADHAGAAYLISQEFKIGTFIMPWYMDDTLLATYEHIKKAILQNDSAVLYGKQNDHITIDGVEVYALNPTETLSDRVNCDSMANVLTFGEAKVLLGADEEEPNEELWLNDETLAAKIKDCTVIKLGHHGNKTSNSVSYLNHVNADKVIITNSNEYGCSVNSVIQQLTNVHGHNLNDIAVTGRQGLIKVTLDGTSTGVTVENEYVRKDPYYADYSEVENVIAEYNSYDGIVEEQDVLRWEEALSLVEYDLTNDKQAVVDGMAEHLGTVYADILNKRTITAVDPDNELVWETVIPYDDGNWLRSENATANGTMSTPAELDFYSEIPVVINGEKTYVDVTWSSDDYKAEAGEYSYTATADGYEFKDGIEAKVVVKVVNGAISAKSARFVATASYPEVNYNHVIKNNVLYDATGCNELAVIAPASSLHFDAGMIPSAYSAGGRYGDSPAVTGEWLKEFNGYHSMSVIDSRATVIGAGNVSNADATSFNGTSYIYVDTFEGVAIVGGTTLLNKATVNETGSAVLDITGKIILNDGGVEAGIYSGGFASKAGAMVNNTNENGSVTLNIFDLDKDSVIPRIVRGIAGKGGTDARTLAVNLDDTSKHLVANITDLGTDENIKVYINGELYVSAADYTAVEEALAKVPADLTIYTDETAQAVTNAVNAVVYDLKADRQATVDAYAQAIEDAVSKLTLKPVAEAIVLTDALVNYRLRCTTAVVDGNLVLTANPSGTSSMKVRLGNLPEGATVAIVGTNANASMSSGIITVTNPGMKNVEVPMTITSAEGAVTEFVLVADFNNAIRYATYARLSQTGNDITVTSGAATAYVLFDTTDIDGGYVEVTDVTRNLLGRYVVSGSAVRFYNPVYDNGTVTVNVKNGNGETVETYNVTAIFADATEYTPVLSSSLRCTYEVDGDNITVTADAGVSNVYLNFGRYYSETLTASANNEVVKKMGARSWRIMATDEPLEFDLYFDATAYGGSSVTRHVTVNF